jgi:biopolymer transport protein ExbD
VVSVTSEGRFFLQTKEIQLADMTEQLYDVIRLQPFNLRRVILKVDEDARFQYAVDALDRIRLAGDRVKQETRENPKFEGLDGGDVKVPISYLRK